MSSTSSQGIMETWSGRMLSLLEPRVEDVTLPDIAWSLAMQCRFNGHVKFFWSVGQHCLLVADILRRVGCGDDVQLCGLLHDAAEAYVGDVTAPMKAAVPEVKPIEERVLRVIYSAFDVQWPDENTRAIVKQADYTAIYAEAGLLVKSQGVWWQLDKPLPVWQDVVPAIRQEDPEAVAMRYSEEVLKRCAF